MAVSTITKPFGIKAIYTGSGTYQNDIGSTVQMTENVGMYSLLRFEVYAGSISSTNRRYIVVNNLHAVIDASYHLYATPTGYGSLRLKSTGDSITLLSCTESSLYVGNIVGFS